MNSGGCVMDILILAKTCILVYGDFKFNVNHMSDHTFIPKRNT